MTDTIPVRPTTPDDLPALTTLYRDAFADEDLLPIVTDIVHMGDRALSLVSVDCETMVGHVAFSPCSVGASPSALSLSPAPMALLAPLAVAPARQRQGIGRALVEAGFAMLRERGISHVFVLGDPAYYARLGFLAERAISPPYDLPDEWDGAWQSKALGAGGEPIKGRLEVPEIWQKPALWLP
ncbi:MAG: N-acetyltransferase [Pseudomonadota bacterium]